MAGKLYAKQGVNISVRPVSAETKQATLKPISDVLIKHAAQMAQDNYAMGNSIALQESLEYAYKQSPDSPEQFSKLADSAIKESADKLPNYVQKKLMDNFVLAKQKYLARVETNYYNKIDTEHTDSVHKSSELATNDALTQVDTLYQAVINRDDRNADIALKAYNNARNNLITLSETKNMKGEYIYNQQERKSAQNSQTGHLEAFKRHTDTLSKDELISFDTDVFQDKLLFQQKTGADDKTYAEMDKYIKGRRKDLGDEEKRVITNQASFAAGKILSSRDPEEYDELKKSGILPKEVFSAIDKVLKTAPSSSKVANAYILEKTIKELYDEIGTFDPRFDDAENIQKAIIAFGNRFEQFSNENGLDQQQQQEVLDMASRYISDKMFRDAAKPLFEDTAISAAVRKLSNLDTKSSLGVRSPIASVVKEGSKVILGTQILGNKELAEQDALNVAHEYMRLWALYSMAGDFETANKIYQEGNRATIITANSYFIPESEFNRMERDLASGKKAYTTLPDGRTVEFKGYSNKDAIIETKI